MKAKKTPDPFLLAILATLAVFIAGCPAPTADSSASGTRPTLSPIQHGEAASRETSTAGNEKSGDVSPASGSIVPIDWPARIDAKQLRPGVRDAIDYLVRTTDENGKFAYIVNTDPEIPPNDEYNVVRHAGTMYGLGMYLDRYEDKDGSIKAALIRQGKFLASQIEPVPGQKDMLAIWSDPAVTGRDEPRKAALGSAGLGLIGLTSLNRAAPGSVPKETLAGLARFILFMQRKDGSFYARYVPEGEGRVYVKGLRFYPGEAALGLILLYKSDGNPQWLKAAARALHFMAHQRNRIGEPMRDHWMLLATAEAWPHLDEVSDIVSREELIGYSIDLCELLMTPGPKRIDDMRMKGCITGDGMTCPTATRVEGLVSALSYLPAEHSRLRAKIQRVAEEGILFLLACQVAEGPYRGGIPYAMFRLPEDHRLLLQHTDYNRQSGEIRIDYVHHAISGMMLYDDICIGK